MHIFEPELTIVTPGVVEGRSPMYAPCFRIGQAEVT